MLVTRFLSLLLFMVMIIALISLMIVILRQQQQRQVKRKSGELPGDEGIRHLIAQGQLDEAVELYSRFTGTDTYTARAAIHEIASEMGIFEDEESSHEVSAGRHEK